MAQEANRSQAPMLCATGCGFYGSPRTSGLCSVCYKEHLQRQGGGAISPAAASVGSLAEPLPVQCADVGVAAAPPAPDSTSPSTQPSPTSGQSLLPPESVASPHGDSSAPDKAAPETGDLQVPSASAPADAATQPPAEPSPSPEKPKQKKNRCFLCRKKVGLTGFECRCGQLFCGAHRYSDVHGCSYNYKADAAERLRKENPVVVGEKIQKI